MKQFSVVLCFALVAVASAGPGYRYQIPQQARPALPAVNLRPQAPISNNGIYSPLQAPPLPQVNVQTQQAAAPVYSQQLSLPIAAPAPAPAPASAPVYSQQLSLPIPAPVQNFVPPPPQPINYQQQAQPISFQQQAQPINFQQPQQINYQQPIQQVVQRPSIVTKDIYIHSAPEEIEDVDTSQQLDNVPLRKNYRIVFIKAPTTNFRQTVSAIRQAQATNEEKTVIYVLSKKPDVAELQKQLQIVPNEAKVHKPEVYFIKYKTQEEAQRAQQEIQAQYDALGGATHVSDEGVAPITSVSNLGGNIGSGQVSSIGHGSIGNYGGNLNLGGNIGQGGNSFSQGGGSFGVSVPSQKYLPVKK